MLWVGLAYFIVQILEKKKIENAFIVACIFSLPATFLWLPNPFMPDPVRVAHFVETLFSNFLFGFIALGGCLVNLNNAIYSFQPCNFRTATIFAKISFQVCGCKSISLGNIQPSQQICLKALVSLPSFLLNQ